MLNNFESAISATAVERVEGEGAIIIGRLNCDEFAMGSSNENSIYGSAKNAVDSSRVAGGSSGGCAVAVAADLCEVAIGSDTGGSVRQPAAFNGVIGFKPTYGRISRNGLIAYASSLDQIGIIGKDLSQISEVFNVVKGEDELDSTTVAADSDETSLPEKFSIAFSPETIEHPALNPVIKAAINSSLQELKVSGQTVNPIRFEYLDYLVSTYYIIAMAEASSNLSRYDGMHYGHRSKNGSSLQEVYTKSRSEGFGDEVKRRIMMGTFVLSEGYYDDYYQKALKVRDLVCQESVKIFEEFDFIITPTTPDVAFKLEEKRDDPVELYLEDIYTVYANLAGLPAISLPLGKDENELPFGIQIMAAKNADEKLLQFSTYFLQKLGRSTIA